LKPVQLLLLVIFLVFANVAHVLCATVEDGGEVARSSSNEARWRTNEKGKAYQSEAELQMDEVVVTATLLPTPAQKLPVRVQVIAREEIEKTRANNLSELLIEKLPSQFQKYPGALSAVEIRGFRTDTMGSDIKGRVLLLIDGHRAGTGNIAVIPVDNVERVEIVRGPGSVIYGSAAMGGVINIITRKGKGKPSVHGTAEYGSFNQYRVAGEALGGLFDERVGFSGTASHLESQDYTDGSRQRVKNTKYRDETYALSLHAAPVENHTLFASGSYFHIPVAGTPGPTYAPDFDDHKEVLRRYGSIAYDGSLRDSDVNWHISGYGVFDRSTANDPAVEWGYSSSTTETTTNGVKSHLSIPTFSLGRMLLGFDWDEIGVTSETSPRGFNYSPDTTYDNFAGFAEQQIDWNRLSLLLGVRYDYFDEAIKATEGLNVVPRAESFDHVSWRAGAKYFLWDWLGARAAVGTGFRVPAADELAGRYDYQSYMKIIGNPNLNPEKSTTWEVGLDAEYLRLSGGLGFFYTDYTDKITGGFNTCVDGDCTWTTYENVKGAIFSGLEGYINCQIPFPYADWIRLSSYADFIYYTQREIEDDSYAQTLGSSTVPYVPEASMTGGIRCDFNGKSVLQFNVSYFGPQVVQDWDYTSSTYGKGVDKSGFPLFSLRFDFHPVKAFNVYLAADNLLDREYSFVNGYPMPGRTIRAGLQARF